MINWSNPRSIISVTALLVPLTAYAQETGFYGWIERQSLLQLVLALMGVASLFIFIGLMIVRPRRTPPHNMATPMLIGVALTFPITAATMAVIGWSDSLVAGGLALLLLAVAFVAFMKRWWRRRS